jgi:hypothetical protein
MTIMLSSAASGRQAQLPEDSRLIGTRLVADFNRDETAEVLKEFIGAAGHTIELRASNSDALLAQFRVGIFQTIVWDLCDAVGDLDGDGVADLLVSVVETVPETGGGVVLCRAFSGANWIMLGQMSVEWNADGVSQPWLVQVAGDVVVDGVVDGADVGTLFESPPDLDLLASDQRAALRVADESLDGYVGAAEILNVAIIASSAPQSNTALVRARLVGLTQSTAGLLGDLWQWLTTGFCAQCAIDCASQLDAANALVDECNRESESCREVLEHVDADPEDVVRCWRQYERCQAALADLLRGAGGTCSKCILKCVPKLVKP